MKKRKSLVVANWKMYIHSVDDVKSYVAAFRRSTKELQGVDVVIAPPFPFIAGVAASLFSKMTPMDMKKSPLHIGAQTVSPCFDAKNTGEVSVEMLKSLGVSHVIVGHSERRSKGETDEQINQQIARAVDMDIIPILCVGEAARDDSGTYVSAIAAQLISALKNISQKVADKLVVAYEPLWAIGRTQADAMQPADVEEMVIFIRKTLADLVGRDAALRVPVLYGGSVGADNVAALLANGGVSGFLVGRESSNVDSFISILNLCAA